MLDSGILQSSLKQMPQPEDAVEIACQAMGSDGTKEVKTSPFTVGTFPRQIEDSDRLLEVRV
jgi:hypothetical protein